MCVVAPGNNTQKSTFISACTRISFKKRGRTGEDPITTIVGGQENYVKIIPQKRDTHAESICGRKSNRALENI